MELLSGSVALWADILTGVLAIRRATKPLGPNQVHPFISGLAGICHA